MEEESKIVSGTKSLRTSRKQEVTKIIKHNIKLLELMMNEKTLDVQSFNRLMMSIPQVTRSTVFKNVDFKLLNDISVIFEYDSVSKVREYQQCNQIINTLKNSINNGKTKS